MCSCCLLLLVFPSLFIERTSLLKWLHLTIIFTHVIASVLLYSSVVYLEGDARYTSGEFFLLCSRRLSKLITFTFLCCTLSHLPLLVDFFFPVLHFSPAPPLSLNIIQHLFQFFYSGPCSVFVPVYHLALLHHFPFPVYIFACSTPLRNVTENGAIVVCLAEFIFTEDS